MSGPLAGLRVLDFSQSLAGPFCTQQLADLGAEVVKIEALDGGDLSRTAGPFHRSDRAKTQSGYFHSINRGKQSLAVDLKSEAGVEIVKTLIGDFDVLVENFRVGVMERFGLGYETLAALNPRLVYAAIRGFGDPRSGRSPYVDWPAYDVVSQAMGGMLGITGTADGTPVKIGPGVGDTIPGLYAALGVVSAVLHARATGEGQFVDVGMVDAILGVSERIVYQHSFTGHVPGPEGNHHPFLLPFGIYPASDGFVALACPTEPFFAALVRALGEPRMLDDARFTDRPARARHRQEVIEALSEITARFTKAELTERLGGVVPFGPVYNVADIAADPHFAARDMLVSLDIEGLPGPMQVAGQPLKFSKTPAAVSRPGPNLGQDTEAVLSAHGASAADIARWRAARAIPEEK
ncbi:MAG: CoA transferase [Phenylobacterium sp.]